MKKILILISGIILFTSCTKDEILEPVVVKKDSVVTIPPTSNSIQSTTNGDTTYITKIVVNTPTKYKLYKESIKNQRSGIFFQTQENYGVNPLYLPQSDEYSKSWYGGGQIYGDVNNDGYMDYMVAVNTSDTNVELKWFINQGDNYNFKVNTSLFNQSTKGISAHKILKTDVNNDNIADYIALGVDERVPGAYSGNFTVLIGNPNGTFDVNDIPNPTKLWFHNGAAGDLNGDGNVDVVAAEYIWYGDGKGNFTKDASINTNGLSYCNSPLIYEIADLNGDGYNDMILSTERKLDATTIVYNNGGKFDKSNTLVKLQMGDYINTSDIEVYDIDSDGDVDIIEVKHLGKVNDSDQWDLKFIKSKLFVHLNNGGSFNYVPNFIQNSEDGDWLNGNQSVGIGYQDKNGWSTFKFDDIDGDGIDDIIPENYHNGKYNGLKKVNGVWKQHIFSFQKCKK